jgi:diguanylate cyclase (GGDEF)-like protein/PAS domain S-box-containing protein
MSIKTRTILTVTAGFMLVSFAIWVLDQWIVQPAFVELERAQALEDGMRARAAIENELRQLDLKLGDWADWDDAYAFADTRDPAFVQSNLGDWGVLEESTQLNLCVILDRAGQRLYSGGYDSELGGEVLPAAFDGDPPVIWSQLGAGLDREEARTGLLLTEQGLLMLSARPIRTTQGTGPARGLLLFGRFLDDSLREMLVAQTQVQWHLFLPEDVGLTSAERSMWSTLPSDGAVLRRGPDGALFVYELLSDLSGQPIALLRTPIRQEISTTARRTSWALMGALGLAALALILAGASFSVRFRREEQGVADAFAWGTATLALLIGLSLSAGLFFEMHQADDDLRETLLFPLIGVGVTLLLSRYLFVLVYQGRRADALIAVRTAELVKRDELLQATSEILSLLLSGRDLNESIGTALAMLGRMIKADRVYIFENHRDPVSGEALMSQRHEWCSDAVTPQRDNPVLQNLPYESTLARWFSILDAGSAVKGLIREFPESERAVLEPQGIRSIMVLPIRLDEGFWGFIGFDDCHGDRVWSAIEESILRTAGSALGQAYVRLGAEKARLASEKRFRDLSALASDWFWEQDDSFRFTYFSIGSSSLGLNDVGLDSGFLIGRTLWELPIHWTPEQATSHREVLESRQAFRDLEYSIRTPAGVERWFNVNGQPMFDDAGHFIGYRGTSRDISERKQAESRIQHLAFFDSLTDLPNRALLAQQAELALGLAARHRITLAVLFIDLDRFKEVNDALGHAEGDVLLLQVAARLKALIRAGDTLSRLGGDEFVLVLPEAGEAGALSVADKVLAAFRQPFVVAGHSLRVTMSVGIAIYPEDGRDFGTLLRNADAALYRAKREGRDTRAFYAPELTVATFERLVLEGELRQAVSSGQLVAYFQPKVRMDDGALVGAEALVRWRHPVHGLIAPARFIPMAEASELIVTIGDWMLAEVCRQLASWRRQGLPTLTVAVNLTARHFRRPSLVDRIKGLLEIYDLPPTVLELELTESTLLGIEPQTVDTLNALERLGVGLAIDDFGTGYSSLSYLKQLPLTALKIDQSFVRDLVKDVDDRAIAATIVALGRHLELTVVAEGVETEDQRQILLQQGCHLAQGYLFDMPTPAAAFATTWLAPARERAA